MVTRLETSINSIHSKSRPSISQVHRLSPIPSPKKAESQPSSKVGSPKAILTKDLGTKQNKKKVNGHSKTQVDFSAMAGSIPIVITDQEFQKRKKTFDTFLKLKDLEMMLGVQRGQKRIDIIDRHSSLDHVQILHSKLQNELKAKLRQKKGKMYTNELWSMDYYTAIINSSNLKRKFDHMSNIMLRPTEVKAQELEDLCKKKIDGKESPLLTSSLFKSAQSYRNGTHLIPSPSDPNFDPSPFPVTPEPSSGQALKSMLQNIIPLETPQIHPTHKLSAFSNDMGNSKFFHKNALGEYSLPTTTNLSYRSHVFTKPPKLHTSLEKEFDTETPGNLGSEIGINRSPRMNLNVITARSAQGGLPKFNIAKNTTTVSDYIKSHRAEDINTSTKSTKNFTMKTIDPLRREYLSRPKSQSPSPPPEKEEVYNKMQHLIEQCIDLNYENKDLEKEFQVCRGNINDMSRKNRLKKIHQYKVNEISEALQRKTKFMKMLYSQKQGGTNKS